ncbi:MAG: gliding motility-associated C-terminal domain-containing protein, partial [Bacteroidetes bacterium]|nr:gliding motility-associated C-terminal domain-containing protein [Bacteroidota bacterium]
NIRRWNPLCYINIWIVASMGPVLAGYSTHPESHGSALDGIVIRVSVFGTSYANDIVVAHEMGHYLGLYHTFEGGCTNTDCSIDGDRVCDTPPDQSTAGVACNQPVNSCSTDALSGFSSDQNDLTSDYMDYGNYNCMKVFTQGQSDRMNAAIQTLRSSLLACKSCMVPCPSPVTPGFTVPPDLSETGTTYTFNNTSSGAVSYQWYVNGTLVSTDANLSYTFPSVGSYTVKLVAKTDNALCLDADRSYFVYISCPKGGCFNLPSPTPDTCSIHTFQKKFGGATYEFSEDLAIDPKGYMLVTGNSRSFGKGDPDMFITKFNPAGRIQWSSIIGDAGSNMGYASTFLSDGSSLHFGYTTGSPLIGGANLYRLDASGNLLWSRLYNAPLYPLAGHAILAAKDGGAFICSSTATSPLHQPMILTRIDAAGNVEWSKEYLYDYAGYPRAMIEDGSQLAIVAEGSNLSGIGNMVLIVDKNNGTPAWAKSYVLPGATSAQMSRILPIDNRWAISFTDQVTIAGALTYRCGVLLTDRAGVPQSVYTIDGTSFGGIGRTDIAILSNGNICMSYSPLNSTTSKNPAIAELTPDGQLVHAFRYPTIDGASVFRIQSAPDGGIAAIGNALASARVQNCYLLKTDSALRLSSPPGGNGECSVIEEFPAIGQPAMITTSLPPEDADITVTATDIAPSFLKVQMPSTDYCSNPTLCNQLSISGMDSVCADNATSITYLANRAPGCGLPVHWQLNSSKAAISKTTDSTIELVFKDTGAVTLYAMLTAKCRILKDSITLHAFRSPSSIDLGDDIALCKQSTVVLDAGAGFKSYLWQDGSTQSTYTAWTPGQYNVTALDYCNNPYHDAITITQAPDISFDLGPDTSVCRNDTLLLRAPDGFIAYTWSPAGSMESANSPTAKAYPQKDMTFICIATKDRGCQILDSIHVQIKERPQHFLSISPPQCLDNEVQLQPIGQWQAYQWFDGSTSRQVTVTHPGVYKLEVTGYNGCPGWDSIAVEGSICNPGVYFPNAFTPDGNGRNHLFKPIVGIPIDEYHLIIFNRLGEKLFETHNFTEGWDGRYRGNRLDAGSFVWYAQFHVQGSSASTINLKGTVTLIR